MTRLGKKFSNFFTFADFYDVIVGSDTDATHSSIASGLSALSQGGRMLVLESESLSSTQTISVSDVDIDFLQNVTISDNGAGTGLSLNADRITLRGGRFSGFTTALEVQAGAQFCQLRDQRFASDVTTPISDSGTKTSVLGTIQE